MGWDGGIAYFADGIRNNWSSQLNAGGCAEPPPSLAPFCLSLHPCLSHIYLIDGMQARNVHMSLRVKEGWEGCVADVIRQASSKGHSALLRMSHAAPPAESKFQPFRVAETCVLPSEEKLSMHPQPYALDPLQSASCFPFVLLSRLGGTLEVI